jgi:hypothetical protein
MLGDKAISVLRLVKPFKLQVPVVVDSDADGDREAAGDMDDEGGDGGDADEGGEDAAAGGEGAAGPGGGARKMLAEVGRDQLLLEMICEVGRQDSCLLRVAAFCCKNRRCASMQTCIAACMCEVLKLSKSCCMLLPGWLR